MSTKYSPGFGSKLYYATNTAGTPGTYNAIGQTKDINGPDSEVGDIKITNNDSPSNCRESAPGIMEPGSISWDLVYSDTVYATLMGIFGDGNIYFFKETFTDGSYIVAPGYLKKAPIKTKTEDEANMVNCEAKLTGKPVFTAGS